MNEKDFTRDRVLTFSITLLFMMNFLRKSLALEIFNFVKNIKVKSFSKSAFVQCRKKINPLVFKELSQVLTHEFYTDNDESVKLWKGFRLLAVDGSRITLPDTKELRGIYGATKNQSTTSVVQGRLSVLYDVLNNYVIDGKIAPLATGEKSLAIEHLAHATSKDLVIYDRGYPSFDLIYEHLQVKIDCLIRVKVSFSGATKDFLESGKYSKVIDMKPGKNVSLKNKNYSKNDSIKVRLIRVDLPDGTTEILITTLLSSKTYPTGIFKDLYLKRWGVEIYYDELKNKIKVELFSGYSDQCIQQDFYAALFISNTQTLMVAELNEELQENQTTQYKYKVNTNLSYGFLKDRIVELLLSNKDIDLVFSELKDIFRNHLIPIRPNRKFERHKDKYRNRAVPKVTKNQRNAL
ncbi:IS4 family transposase [Labilibaculum sp.]|uniref:IS4 family transposase n=1 Tax=Labilibaculum sp. TaxID=2060723 RepID=UPI002AA82B70|nr:IS4 family transposase [Labilibaculum sp.]MBN2598500.1 IS4 family transposase [Marinifilaceae bacterium]